MVSKETIWNTKNMLRTRFFISRRYRNLLQTIFNRTRSFCFNRKKRHQKWKIPFCTISMRDTKKMLNNKIVRFKKIYKLALDYFFIGVICCLLFIKNVFIKIKNSILPPKYKRYGKMLKNKIVYCNNIYKSSVDHFSIWVLFYVY